MRHRCRTILLVLMTIPASVRADTRASVGIPLALEMDGRIAVAVRVNGAGPFRFRLDTGASRTVISSRLAAQPRIAPAGQSRTITQTGQAERRLVLIDELIFGPEAGQAASNLVALTLQPHELDSAGKVEGLLGQDVLSRWIYTI